MSAWKSALQIQSIIIKSITLIATFHSDTVEHCCLTAKMVAGSIPRPWEPFCVSSACSPQSTAMSVTLSVSKDGRSSLCVALWLVPVATPPSPRDELFICRLYVLLMLRMFPVNSCFSAASAALCLAVFTASRSFFLGHRSAADP